MEPYCSSENPKKINVISTFAFMFSVLIYVSVFYFCRISPLILLHTTKFWFFLSNNLVLIIAIDYSTFSASKQDLYLENIANSQTRSVSISPFVKQDQEYIVKARASKTEFENDWQEKDDLNGESRETIVGSDIQVEESGRRSEVEEAERDLVSERENNPRYSEREKEEEEEEEEQEQEKEEQEQETNVDNEFSTLTDEELNRRVEDFIRRFNNEIRLEALRNSHQKIK